MSLEFFILEGPQAGRRLRVGSDPATFGRGPAAMYSFPQDTFMSGMHLTAQEGPQGVVLTDNRSTNGSFVNGQRFTQVVARSGDVIKIGSLTMQVVPEQTAVTMPVLSSPTGAEATVIFPVRLPDAERPGSKTEAMPTGSKTEAILGVLSQSPDPLFCLLDAAADELILPLLAVAPPEQVQRECLYDGESTPDMAHCAPYLLQLPLESPLLRVLVDKGWGKGWASYFTSDAAFEDIRKHFGKFLMVQIGQGKEVYFRFYDPHVLREFLPTANNNELAAFFGPVSEWLIEGPGDDELLRVRRSSDGLVTRVASLTDRMLTTKTN